MDDQLTHGDDPEEAEVGRLYDTVRRGLQYRRLPEAVEAAESLLKMQPESTSAHELMGDVLLAQGKRSDARKAYKRAMELEPANADAERKYAQATLMVGETERLQALMTSGDMEGVRAMSGKDATGIILRSAFFPGLGQLYGGDVDRGTVICLVALPVFGLAMWGAVTFLTAALSRDPDPMSVGQTTLALLGIVGYLAFYAWNLWDAYTQGRK